MKLLLGALPFEVTNAIDKMLGMGASMDGKLLQEAAVAHHKVEYVDNHSHIPACEKVLPWVPQLVGEKKLRSWLICLDNQQYDVWKNSIWHRSDANHWLDQFLGHGDWCDCDVCMYDRHPAAVMPLE